MPNKNLTEYVENARKQGLTDQSIRQNLISGGWDENSVNESLGLVVPSPDSLSIPKPPTNIRYASDSLWNWDSFEHILMFLSLYTLLISVGIVLYYFVDKMFPLANSIGYSITSSGYSETFLSGLLSAILVSLPLFSYFFLNVISRTKQNPALRHILARKRLIYITLIVTFIIMVQNLISILNSFLSGNVVANSLAHFVVIVGLSLVVFVYYLNLVSEDKYAAIK